MALAVFLRGVNVGGHKTFRPSILAQSLRRYDVVNIGAAGTFVVRAPVSRTTFRSELRKRLPFETHVMICSGSDIRRLVATDPFAGESNSRDFVQFVSILAKRRPASAPDIPRRFPPAGPWDLRILDLDGQFVLGLYRRQMKAIAWLGKFDQLFGMPATTRSWSTILAVARVLDRAGGD